MNQVFPSDYEEFIYKSRYSRWNEGLNRRENWNETVKRYLDFLVMQLQDKHNYIMPSDLEEELYEAILTFNVMPSMRALMTAGPALERDNTAGYNCSYLPIDSVRSFDELMYILMCGTGVGFSVEKKYIKKLPAIPALLEEEYSNGVNKNIIVVEDSKEGWAVALGQLLEYLYDGIIPDWDVSKLRPAGARLKTFGGRASGPAPLVKLFQFIVELFKAAAGRKLNSLETHDIVCKIGEVVVVGGVRRSAMISLSDLDDKLIARAKHGDWWKTDGQRALANNSAVYTTKPDMIQFLKEWTSLIESNSGERGIFNRQASALQANRNGRRKPVDDFGTNPCSEIILRPYQFCNLTEVVIKSDDTPDKLKRKVELATILGTFQSTLTNFPYLRDIWKANTEEERLLGVSLTGIMDNSFTSKVSKELEETLNSLRNAAIAINKHLAKELNINVSTAISCIKPSGTVSQLVNSASGIHDRHSDYYIRTVRADNKDPLTQFLKDSGIPFEPAVGKEDDMTVFSFPIKAPKGSVKRNERTAIEQLELVKFYQDHWCEHKPSVTISVKEDEWLDVAKWVYTNFDSVTGISFLPYDGGSYVQAPYQECSEDEYLKAVENSPKKLDWSTLSFYEKEDNTTGSQTLACVGAVCELVSV